MKCKNMIVIEERKRRGTGEPYQKVVQTLGRSFNGSYPKEAVLTTGIRSVILCDGDIRVTVDIEDIGDCRCSGGSLNVVYLCLRCGNRSFNEFPESEDALSKFMTKVIAEMPDSKYEEILKVYLDQRAAWDKSVQKHRKEALDKIRIRKEGK